MPGNGKNGGSSLEHPLTMKYACRKGIRRGCGGCCCCCSSGLTATVAGSQPELTTQSCHSTVLHATDSTWLCSFSLPGRLGEKLMKSHKSQTSGRLCTLYELLCSTLLCCAPSCVQCRRAGSRRRFEGTKAPLSTKATRTQPQLQQQLNTKKRRETSQSIGLCRQVWVRVEGSP